MFNSVSVIETLERKGAELDFLRLTTHNIQEANTPDDAIRRLIEHVCVFTQWPVGHAYIVSQDGYLDRSPIWHLADAEQFGPLQRSIEELPVSDGIGLAEKVFELAEGQWTRGLYENRHTALVAAARKVGITTAFAFPISVNLAVKAVVEFFCRSDDAPEQSFLEIMSTLCIQLGRTLERQKFAELEATNRELAGSNARLQQALVIARQNPQPDDRERSRLLTNMGHEFRTPLTAILGFSELLLAEAESTGQKGQSEDLRRIHDAASRLLELVNGIIDLSRIQAREMDLNIEDVEVPRLVHALCESMRESFQTKANTLKVDCGRDAGVMHTDSQKVLQCLTHLITNANKFTENGVIELTVSRLSELHEERIVFRVTDTGIGMTQDQVARLFQPFSQADSSAARRHGGLGLGLALTENLAKLLGGRIHIDSVLGEGTTFLLELPARTRSPVGGNNNDDNKTRATTLQGG